MSQELKPWELTVELSVIENLGLNMYVTIPPVLSEMVANAWDADAPTVKITLPEMYMTDDSKIVVEDSGNGMTYEEITAKFLRIGRKRRLEDEKDTSPGGRKLMGRKGLGKLAPFGVARVVQVETCKDYICNSFVMVLDDILKAAKERKSYFPKPLKVNQKVEKKQGTTISLSSLNRKTPLDILSYKRSIAKRFSVISSGFEVELNGIKLGPDDWLKSSEMQYHWDINECVSKEHETWRITGWIGTALHPVPEEQMGVIIMARGKLVQETPFYFGAVTGEKHSYAYISGIIHAEFLDEGQDLIATNRGSVVWESPEGEVLLEWGKQKLAVISAEWEKRRRALREKVIREDPEFKDWLSGLSKADLKIADRVIKAITIDEDLSDDRRKNLARFMMDSFEQQVFHEMVAQLPDDPQDARLIEVFDEWDLIEAKEVLRIVKGRIATVEQFIKFVKENAKEIPTIHNFFKEWPWLLDPSWTQFRDEAYFSDLLRETFPDKSLNERDRRIDFVCVGSGDTVHVVELKRPGHVANADNLEQLLDYVSFVKGRLGNAPGKRYGDAAGYLVCGELSNDHKMGLKIEALYSKRMYVKRYDDLITIATQLHDEFKRKLEFFVQKRKNRNSEVE